MAAAVVGAAGFNGTKIRPDGVESTHVVLAHLQRAHVASVMSVHMLAPRHALKTQRCDGGLTSSC